MVAAAATAPTVPADELTLFAGSNGFAGGKQNPI